MEPAHNHQATMKFGCGRRRSGLDSILPRHSLQETAPMIGRSTLLFWVALVGAIAATAVAGCGQKKDEPPTSRDNSPVVIANSEETKPGRETEPPPAARLETARSILSTTAQELRDQFTKDKNATKKKYENAALELSGTIGEIVKGYEGEAFLIFSTKGGDPA